MSALLIKYFAELMASWIGRFELECRAKRSDRQRQMRTRHRAKATLTNTPHSDASGTRVKALARTAQRERANARLPCVGMKADTDHVAQAPAAILLVHG